ncbi:MAG TPA: HD domain-containing protein [Bdellovibrionales bacterium]|nr:HD domain-containing protein [Bdellovibrionales bacterium]
MEIKDPIHGAIDVSAAEVAVIDSREFQRLRAIKQLGFAEHSFPGATHNRYIHSVGVMHLAGRAFDSVFRSFQFSSPAARQRLRNATRLGALLHDIGHGPLSHTTEEVMPNVDELAIDIYKTRAPASGVAANSNRQATHEDYTIKFLTDSPLSKTIQSQFPDLSPVHVACLVDRSLAVPDDFFVDHGLDLRPVLSQIISSEMDVDRMDYLGRDAYFCGTNYGKVEIDWLIGNLTCHEVNGKVNLALNRRALYTFDDFLISRHHMYLMIYFHHKSIIYEEMLMRYLTSPDCTFILPASLDKYVKSNDYALYEHLASVDNRWARRIADRNPFRMLFELHATDETKRPVQMKEALEAEGIETILASSSARLSKYHATHAEQAHTIFVVDQYDLMEKPIPIEQCTSIFQRYEETRRIERLYVAPENYQKARKLVSDRRL